MICSGVLQKLTRNEQFCFITDHYNLYESNVKLYLIIFNYYFISHIQKTNTTINIVKTINY